MPLFLYALFPSFFRSFHTLSLTSKLVNSSSCFLNWSSTPQPLFLVFSHFFGFAFFSLTSLNLAVIKFHKSKPLIRCLLTFESLTLTFPILLPCNTFRFSHSFLIIFNVLINKEAKITFKTFTCLLSYIPQPLERIQK